MLRDLQVGASGVWTTLDTSRRLRTLFSLTVINTRFKIIQSCAFYIIHTNPRMYFIIMFHLQDSQLSWNAWYSGNFKIVLKLSWNQKLSWNFSNLVRMSWYWRLLCRSYGIVFILYLVTSTGLCRYQYFWRYRYLLIYYRFTLVCSLVSTEKPAFFMSWLELCETGKIVPKFTKNLVLKFHFLFLGALHLQFQTTSTDIAMDIVEFSDVTALYVHAFMPLSVY